MNIRTIVLSLVLIPVLSASVSAADYGILGIYKAKKGLDNKSNIIQLKHNLARYKCSISREGMVFAENGDIDLPKPDHFLFITCDTSLPGRKLQSALLQSLKASTRNLALFEGPLKEPYETTPSSGTSARSYILKVSNYNNKDPEQREADLAILQKKVTGLPNQYFTEAEIMVTRAYGAMTPDEAVIIYYDTAKQGERFRKGNPKILKEIGAFNNNHLDAYIYYVGQLL